MFYRVFFGLHGVVTLVLVLVMLTGMGKCVGTPTEGPRIDARGNTGIITTNITDGSSSPIGTAPCGATSNQKSGGVSTTGADCSTDAPVVVVPPVTPTVPVVVTNPIAP